MSETKYLDESDIYTAFDLVKQEFNRKYDEIPIYENEAQAIEQLKGLLERLKMDKYYPGLMKKASILFINTIKGHYFSNGNKRLGIVITIIFLIKNDLDIGDMTKEKYRTKLNKLFPEYQNNSVNFKDEADFTPTDFGFYNLAKIIASNKEIGVELDTLKLNVNKFLSFVTSKESSNFIDRFKFF